MSSSSQSYLQDQEIKRLQYSIAIVTIIMSSFAIFLTIIFFIFNIRYRNFRLIKMSSPNINNIINFNCILLYVCPILNSIKGLYITNDFLPNLMCQINTWILPLASTAIYASMLAKAWRIYKIFETTPKAKKIVIKDIRLVVYICCLVAFDALIVCLWQFLDTIKLKPRYVYEIQAQPTQVILPASYFTKSTVINSADTSPSPLINLATNLSDFDVISSSFLTTVSSGSGGLGSNDDSDIVISGSISQPVVQNYSQKNQLKLVFECNSSYNEVWVTILTMYKIILLMYGIYLAWIIRNINVPSMNDSKYLLLSTYTIIVCGLGSMTLMQLLSNWPDVVQAFFTIGIILSTCTTQCLLFIPKIRLWYKRKNDDNFKISLSQVFLHASSNCYYSDKQNKNSSNVASAANMLNIEEELCELLHENSQLKNYLKEKEEVIKLLQDKIRMAKAKLIQVTSGNLSETQNNKTLLLNASAKTDGQTDVTTYEIYQQSKTKSTTSNTNGNSLNETYYTNDKKYNNSSSTAYYNLSTSMGGQNMEDPPPQPDQNRLVPTNGLNLDSGFDVDSSTCTATTTTETVRTSSGDNGQQGNGTSSSKSQTIYQSNKQLFAQQKSSTNATEQLKNDLDEVEELTTRVRDSISVDLSNTRRYSPLLYEYYRKQLELAKSIQSTYNIQCHTLFDAMTLMRKCLKDYCHTVVHNPEYLAIDAIAASSSCSTTLGGHSGGHHHSEYTYNDFLSENNLALSSKAALNSGSQPGGNLAGGSLPFNKQILLNSSRLKPSLNIVETPVSSSSGSTSFASTCSISTSSLNAKSNANNNLFNNNNYESTNLETTKPKISAVDNKQTYV